MFSEERTLASVGSEHESVSHATGSRLSWNFSKMKLHLKAMRQVAKCTMVKVRTSYDTLPPDVFLRRAVRAADNSWWEIGKNYRL